MSQWAWVLGSKLGPTSQKKQKTSALLQENSVECFCYPVKLHHFILISVRICVWSFWPLVLTMAKFCSKWPKLRATLEVTDLMQSTAGFIRVRFAVKPHLHLNIAANNARWSLASTQMWVYHGGEANCIQPFIEAKADWTLSGSSWTSKRMHSPFILTLPHSSVDAA